MKTEQIELTVTPRKPGKHHSRGSRLSKQIPAVIYGPKMDNKNLLTDEMLLSKYSGRKFESTIFKLKSEDTQINGQAVLLKAIQVHPLTRRPVHVDFYAVDMSSTIRLRVEIRLEGKPAGIAEGGLLQAVMREVEIECLPTQIPEYIAADVSHLGVGDSLHVSDLHLGEEIRMMTTGQQTIATVALPKEEAAPTAAAAAPAAAAATPAAAPAAGGAGTKK